MNRRVIPLAVVLALIPAVLIAAPTSNPASDADAPQLTELQQNLLMQLSDAEANIQAINKALVHTGYAVGQAYHQIDSNLKGSEYMNRNGGGPVRWDAFYGKTAKDFVMHDPGSPVYHQLQRPTQFNYIYKANSDQVARAKEQIASLAQDKNTLLERRRKHEADQSRLWAILSWQQVKDREIDFHPICRYALKPAGPDAAVLRPLILYLRIADRVAVEGIDSITDNQQTTFDSASQRLEAAFSALQLSLSDALDDSNLNPKHKAEAVNLKSLCKDLSDECKVIASNYANALDRDQAQQDTSKLEFRGQLQTSLAKFAAMTGQLDEDITNTAKSWGINPDRTTATPDTIPASALAPASAPTANANSHDVTVVDPSPKTANTSAAALFSIGSVWLPVENSRHPNESAKVLSVDGSKIVLEVRSGNGATRRWTFEMTENGHLKQTGDDPIRVPKNAPLVTDIQVEGTVTSTNLILKGHRRRGNANAEVDMNLKRQP